MYRGVIHLPFQEGVSDDVSGHLILNKGLADFAEGCQGAQVYRGVSISEKSAKIDTPASPPFSCGYIECPGVSVGIYT